LSAEINPVEGEHARSWREGLESWAIPQAILDQAPQRPFVFPAEMFAAPPPGVFEPGGSTRIAAAALAGGGVVLDVGCGGGAAAFALTPPATELIGTDRQPDMTALFAQTAAARGIPAQVFPGVWPAIADQVPAADVVVSHNVLYNVPNIVEFCVALTSHALRRVVIEITEFHPQTNRAPLWKHFWNLERPTEPTAWIAQAALAEAGIDVQAERTLGTERDRDRASPVEAAFWTRQLCLPSDREPEVAGLIADVEFPPERVTLWWDAA
jgi:SAM-dependent methyltransferase